MHARKTRQRKKEHMQNLQGRAEELKMEQIRLRQTINEKNTASILVGLFSINMQRPNAAEDPAIENLLRRPVEEIPDSSKIPELPALILPGQHNSRRLRTSLVTPNQEESPDGSHFPDDGIDYELLGKDRSKCTPAELDQIRRERNRMHAKRTRDRKRLFMEEMEGIIRQLERENVVLKKHLESLGSEHNSGGENTENDELEKNRTVGDQINCLLAAAGACQSDDKTTNSSEATAISASSDGSGSCCSEQDHEHDELLSAPAVKRRKVGESSVNSAVPMSITTGSPTAVGC